MSAHGNGGTKAILAALGANLGIAVAKLIGFLLTGASSMLAESVHSLADTTNQALLLVGNKQAKRDQDERHPFGYGATRYFWSFVVALVLFSLGGMFAVYEGVHKIRHPEELDRPIVAIAILIVAILLESYSFRTAITESIPLKGNQSWFSFIKTSRVPELPVLLLEDFGALAGLTIALCAIGLSLVTDNPVWDGYGTLAIGALLLVIAAVLIVEMRGLLLGESATRADVDKITDTIQSTPDVERLIHMRTLHQGPEDVLVAAKVQLRAGMSFEAVAETINTIEARIRHVLPIATMIYIEPARFDPNHSGPSRLSDATDLPNG